MPQLPADTLGRSPAPPGAAPTDSREAGDPVREVRVEVDHRVRLAVRQFEPSDHLGSAAPPPAAAAPFVLVHGLASNARTWDGVAERLAQTGHQVAALDQRGHGRSDKPDTGYDFARITDDLAGAITGLGIVRPVVVGQSWGGNVVLELAYRFPDLVRGVACVDGGTIELADSFATWEQCAARLAPPRLAGQPAAAIEAYLRSAHPDWPETGIRGTFANFEIRADGTIAPWLTFERHMAILRALWEHRPSSRFAAIRVPVLLIPADTGDEEWTAAKRESIRRAEATLPLARVHWFVPAHHDIQAEHPDELADLLHAAATDGFFPTSGLP